MSGSRARDERKVDRLAGKVRELASDLGRHLDDVAIRGACAERGHPEGFDCGSREHPGTRRVREGRYRRDGGTVRERVIRVARDGEDGRNVERWTQVRRRRRVARYRRRLEKVRRRARATRKVATGLVLLPVRVALNPLGYALRLVSLVVAVLIVATLIPGDQVKYLPGTYSAASCEAPAGPFGIETAAYKAGQGVAWFGERDAFTVEELAELARTVLSAVGEAFSAVVDGLRDRPPPKVTVLEQRELEVAVASASAPGCAAPCTGAGGEVVRQASTASSTGDQLVAEVARRYWTSPEDQLKAVQVALAESGGDPSAVNPQLVDGRHRAHGLWQTLLPMHEARYGGDRWDDPDANARVAHLLWLERGWAPWNASASAHGRYEERARAALAGTSTSTAASAAPCPTGIGGQMTLASTGPVPAFPNGYAPAEALVTTSAGVQVRRDVAPSLEQLAAAYLAEFGTPLVMTDGYRNMAGQRAVRSAKPGLAAVPGTSKHGLGIAIDLGGGVQRFGTAQHVWMVSNAPRFGWMHPAWARQGGKRPEPWHFEAIVAPQVTTTGPTRST